MNPLQRKARRQFTVGWKADRQNDETYNENDCLDTGNILFVILLQKINLILITCKERLDEAAWEKVEPFACDAMMISSLSREHLRNSFLRESVR